MTDTGNEERPLTRRELRARERAAAQAAREKAEERSEAAQAAEGAEPAEQEEQPQQEAPAVEDVTAAEPVADEPAVEEPAPTQAMSIEHLAAERETQPLAPEDLPAPSSEVSGATESIAEETDPPSAPEAPDAPEPVEESAAEDSAPRKGVGRFFGRRKLDNSADTDTPEDFDELLGVEPAAEPAEGDQAVGIEDLASELAEDAEQTERSAEETEPVAAEQAAEETTGAVTADSPEVDAPARARGLRLDEGRRQNLDSISDEDVDSVEIDEVEVTEARISAQAVSEKTPAQLEDTRGESFEQDEELPSGPTRGRGSKLPFVVNVVEDTSEHHISDLRRGSEGLQGQNGSSGNITANALVLPASGQEDEIQFESEDGVLVTGSIDLPDGYAASGRARGKFDSPDIDSSPDGSEVSNPETAPVRASRAVSSYASARVNIAPKRQSRSALPWALGIGGGVVFAGIVVVVVGYTAGWF